MTEFADELRTDVKGVIVITLKDLSAAVGVSPSAVSLVLNHRDKGRVNPETAARIRETASRMGYIPNQLARGLKTRKTNTIGVISDRVASVPFAGRMLEGLHHVAWAEGYLAMVIDTSDDAALVERSAQSLLQRDVDAVVVAAQYHRVIELPTLPPTIPVVTLDGTPDGDALADGVVPDEFAGAFDAVTHLLDNGHTRVGFCTVGTGEYIAAPLRYEGYVSALASRGIAVDRRIVCELDDLASSAAYPGVRALLESPDRPTAVFCFSDQIAFAAYQAAADLGLRVPRDLSIVGFDDQEFIADALRPALTTVKLPHFEMGAWAARRVLDRLHAKQDLPPAIERIACPLVERGSVAPPGA